MTDPVKLLGLMSGTSLDGIDAVLLQVVESRPAAGEGPEGGPGGGETSSADGRRTPDVDSWDILAFRTRPYESGERETIRHALERGGPRDLARLHTRLGELFAEAALALLATSGVAPGEVAALGSHGQTVWHDPPVEGRRGSSLQLGCPATLAERTGVDVVSDFRSRDLAAGGHGAPLVPWADRILFSSPHGPRALQNLGGMANVTWLPCRGSPAPPLAFDTGPGVALLNMAASLATDGGTAFDEGGRLARQGAVSEPLLSRLLDHPFFAQEPPRSTGRELFGPVMLREAVETLGRERGRALVPGSPEDGWPDLLATLVALTARSMGDAYRKWVVPKGVEEVFLLGGGARNPALVDAIQGDLAPLPVRSGEALGMDPDAREAAAFALLAWAHLRGVPANVWEATGSEGPRVLGSLTPA